MSLLPLQPEQPPVRRGSPSSGSGSMQASRETSRSRSWRIVSAKRADPRLFRLGPVLPCLLHVTPPYDSWLNPTKQLWGGQTRSASPLLTEMTNEILASKARFAQQTPTLQSEPMNICQEQLEQHPVKRTIPRTNVIWDVNGKTLPARKGVGDQRSMPIFVISLRTSMLLGWPTVCGA